MSPVSNRTPSVSQTKLLEANLNSKALKNLRSVGSNVNITKYPHIGAHRHGLCQLSNIFLNLKLEVGSRSMKIDQINKCQMYAIFP